MAHKAYGAADSRITVASSFSKSASTLELNLPGTFGGQNFTETHSLCKGDRYVTAGDWRAEQLAGSCIPQGNKMAARGQYANWASPSDALMGSAFSFQSELLESYQPSVHSGAKAVLLCVVYQSYVFWCNLSVDILECLSCLVGPLTYAVGCLQTLLAISSVHVGPQWNVCFVQKRGLFLSDCIDNVFVLQGHSIMHPLTSRAHVVLSGKQVWLEPGRILCLTAPALSQKTLIPGPLTT